VQPACCREEFSIDLPHLVQLPVSSKPDSCCSKSSCQSKPKEQEKLDSKAGDQHQHEDVPSSSADQKDQKGQKNPEEVRIDIHHLFPSSSKQDSCCSKDPLHDLHHFMQFPTPSKADNCCNKDPLLDFHHLMQFPTSSPENDSCCNQNGCEQGQSGGYQPPPCSSSQADCCKDGCEEQPVHIQSPPPAANKEQSACCSQGACHSQGESGKQATFGTRPTGKKLEKLVFKVDGMCCASEVEHIKTALRPFLDARETIISFDLINGKLILEGGEGHLPSEDKVTKSIARTGMKATLWQDHVQRAGDLTFWQRYGHYIMNVVSFIGLMVGYFLHAEQHGYGNAAGGEVGGEEASRPEDPPAGTLVAYCISIVAGSWYIFPKAIAAVRRMRPDPNLLMTLAALGALGIGHWFEAASSMYLFSAAGLLEAWNMSRARKAISALMDLAPATARVIDAKGITSEQPVEKVPVGARLVVRPGEKIPMDSVVVTGSTSVNQAPITGESMPVDKEVGDALFAGTINGDYAIQCEVTRAAADSTLATIIRKVEEAQSHRARSDLWIEVFSGYYIPTVALVALLVAIIPPLATGDEWFPWIYKGLELLVISCPCSLVISTPVSIVAGLTAAARAGVLIKGGVYLEIAATIKAVAMDKTGTLTTGEPKVQTVIPRQGYTAIGLLKLAASLEVHSDHPLARAIVRKANMEGIAPSPASNFQIIKGKGGEGWVNGELSWIGSHRFLHEKIGDHNEPQDVHEQICELESRGHSIVAVGRGQDICGFISIADAIRPESKTAVRAMKQAGIHKVVMLTGDNKGAAKSIADATGVDEYHAELLPGDKVDQVRELVTRYGRVAMVGDGINDAPAMATSSLGIAMGAAGSDAAIETADVALMSDDLGKLAWLVSHARATLNVIKQNVVFSLAIKAIFTGLIFAGYSTLWMAIMADIGGTFVVVSNALRLAKVRKEGKGGASADHDPSDILLTEWRSEIQEQDFSSPKREVRDIVQIHPSIDNRSLLLTSPLLTAT